MHIITTCSRCKKEFMYHQMDVYLFREPQTNIQIKKEYPIQDETWNSRRWNSDKTEFCDLSGWEVICHECDEIESIAEFIKEKAEHRGWKKAKQQASNKFGEDKTNKAFLFINKTKN